MGGLYIYRFPNFVVPCESQPGFRNYRFLVPGNICTFTPLVLLFSTALYVNQILTPIPSNMSPLSPQWECSLKTGRSVLYSLGGFC